MIPIIIKVGTHVLTTDEGVLDNTAIERITNQIAKLHKEGTPVILVSSGAMGAARGQIDLPKNTDPVTERQVLAAVGQIALIDAYRDAFAEHNIQCAQVLTTRDDFRSRHHYLNMKRCFDGLLNAGVVPIVNENDVVSIVEVMFTDNDELAGLIASMMDSATLLMLTSIDGVLDEDGKVIETICADDTSWKKGISTEKSQFGRGGMQSKCTMATRLSKLGITTYIVSGERENIILDTLNEQGTGTRIVAIEDVCPVKKWLATGEHAQAGSATVNECAANILTSDRVTSLLPVGVVSIDGDFEKGDIIRILSHNGEMIGLGKAQYDAEQARKWMGEQRKKPLVHYDYLYIV